VCKNGAEAHPEPYFSKGKSGERWQLALLKIGWLGTAAPAPGTVIPACLPFPLPCPAPAAAAAALRLQARALLSSADAFGSIPTPSKPAALATALDPAPAPAPFSPTSSLGSSPAAPALPPATPQALFPLTTT
jgi:hypothetical protein